MGIDHPAPRSLQAPSAFIALFMKTLPAKQPFRGNVREPPRSARASPAPARVGKEARLRALRKYGNFALAYSATFQPGLEYFGGEEGFLAYKQVGSTAFVLSNPLAPVSACRDLIRRFVAERGDACFWQVSRPVAEILEAIGFSVNQMGIETRIELSDYDFGGPRKRNFRRAINRAACRNYTIAERSLTSLDRKELQMVSERWRQTRQVKHREMTFLTRPAILDDEVDVRKFFTFDGNDRLLAFAFFDPIYEGGEVVGYLCSAKRRLPEADTLVGYAILHQAIRTFRDEGRVVLSLGLSPLCGVEGKEPSGSRLLSFGFRALYRSRLLNKLIYPVQGFAEHKGAFCGSAEQTYCAFKKGLAFSQLIKMPRACNLT
jgi:phosphatidylglycerol lysyltransferase